MFLRISNSFTTMHQHYVATSSTLNVHFKVSTSPQVQMKTNSNKLLSFTIQETEVPICTLKWILLAENQIKFILFIQPKIQITLPQWLRNLNSEQHPVSLDPRKLAILRKKNVLKKFNIGG